MGGFNVPYLVWESPDPGGYLFDHWLFRNRGLNSWGMKNKTEITFPWLYAFKRGDRAVFLNRWDQVIKEFATYQEAEDYARGHYSMINQKIKKRKQTKQMDMFK